MSAQAQPAAVATARKRMREAASGMRRLRAPLDARERPNGCYVIVDGNATFAVAQQDGWERVPVRVVGRLDQLATQDAEPAVGGSGGG
jgi:hypothetical protein